MKGEVTLVELEKSIAQLRRHAKPLPIGAMIDAEVGQVRFLYPDGSTECLAVGKRFHSGPMLGQKETEVKK